MDADLGQRDFSDVVDEMARSMSSVRQVVRVLREKHTLGENALDTKDGISLLSLKHHQLLSYMQSLVLVSSHRALGHSLTERTSPSFPFSSVDREKRGAGAGDMVDSMVEGRVVLEKIKALEARMRYQIEKLVRVAEEAPTASDKGVVDDPLAFRPNPQNLMSTMADNQNNSHRDQNDNDDVRNDVGDGIYHPPRMAAMPYTDKKDKKERRKPVPAALAALQHSDPSRPHMESTTGLGSMPALSSNRAREIHRMTEFEEENFTRIMMNKKDSKRRQKDEEDIALGGSGGIQGRRRGGGLEDEFGDVLRSVGRSRQGAVGDGYEELRSKGKKKSVLVRSRGREDDAEGEAGEEDGPRDRKRSRFDKEAKGVNKRANKKTKGFGRA